MYLDLEIQKDVDGQLGTIVSPIAEYPEALSTFYMMASAAVISGLPLHSIVLMTEAGASLRVESFTNETDPASETETYVVMEIQKGADGVVGTIVNAVVGYRQALSKYFMTLASAILSSVPIHSVVFLTKDGKTVATESHTHMQEFIPESYLAIEMQYNADGTVGTIKNAVNDYQEALNRYLTMEAAAKESSVPIHSVLLMNTSGATLRQASYTHLLQANEGETNE